MNVAEAVARMGSGPLTGDGLQQHMRPLFSRALAGGGIYLANHTLGRPLDRTFDDVAEGINAWAEQMRGAWEPWLAEEQRYRAAIAGLLGMARPDCVVPKASAGQALRTVLNTLPAGATVLTTREEFSSVSVVLAQYASLGRLRVRFASPEAGGRWTPNCILDELGRGEAVSLVVVSHVFYADGRVFDDLASVGHACRHRHGADLLVDAYHSVGVIPVSMEALGCGYLIGGCYKYLRGGPGAAFLAMSAERTDGVPHDSGWFAQEPGTDPWQEHGPALRKGGDGWLDGTPPVLPYYQARSGLALVQALGVERIRGYSLQQLQLLRALLAERGIASTGGDAGRGAFVTVAAAHPQTIVKELAAQGIVIDATQGRLRLCPDVLTTGEELARAAEALAKSLT
jgi:kynureninase